MQNRYFFLVLILIFSSLASCGDKKKTDKPSEIVPELPQTSQVNPIPKKKIPNKPIAENPAKKIQSAKKLINDAIQLNDERDYKGALENLKKAIDIGETIETPFPNACLMAGKIYLRFKDYKNATLYYEKYLQNPDKDKAQALESVSDAYYDFGMLYNRFYEVALNLQLDYYTYILEMVASISPKQREATRYFRGLDYYLSGKFDEAISELKKVGKIEKPYDTFAQIKLAACYYEKGNKKAAENIWSKVRVKSGQDNLILSELLLTYAEVGKPIKATELLSQQHNMARTNLVAISSIMGELDQAIDLFRVQDLKTPDMTVYISPTSRANFYRVSIFKAMARVYFLKAAEYYQECIKLAPQKTDEYNYKIGLCLLYADKIDEGIKIFGKISSNPFKSKAEIYTAVGLYRKGDRQKAEQIWNKTAEESLTRELSYVYSRLAIRLQNALDYAYKIRDPLAIAYAHYQTAMESEDQEERIANFTLATQWFDKSRDTLDYYLDANSPVILIDLASSYYHRHIHDEAARIWAHLLDTYPEAYQILETIQLINEIWQMKRSEEFEPRWINLIG